MPPLPLVQYRRAVQAGLAARAAAHGFNAALQSAPGRRMKRALYNKGRRAYKRARGGGHRGDSGKAYFGEHLQKDFRVDDVVSSAGLTNDTWTIFPWRDGSAATGSGTSRIILSSIAQGTARDQRTGRVANVDKIQFRVGFSFDSSATLVDSNRMADVKIRLLLVSWEATNSASVDSRSSQILDLDFTNDAEGFSALRAFRNTDEGGNYKVLFDKTKTLRWEPGQTSYGSAAETLGNKKTEVWFEKNIKVPASCSEIRYTSTGGDVSNHAQRSYVMFYYVDQVRGDKTSNVYARGNARLRYTNA